VKKDDLLSGVLFFFFGAVAVALSCRMHVGTFRAAGSGLFPLLLGMLLMLLSALFLLKSLRPKAAEGEGCPVKQRELFLPVVFFMAIMAAAVLLLTPLGYPAVSFLLMAGLLRTLGFKRWPLNLGLSVLTAAGCYVLFVRWLSIPLPKGFPGL
jgi:hypothetical protein